MAGYFFNGRLWVSPATMSVIDDSAMANQNSDVGNVLCLIGTSTGGQPNTALSFGSPDEAAAVLRSGDLYDMAKKAFSPSDETAGPQTVIAIRVNPAVQASLTLKDASANSVIDLVSTDYGLWTNQIKVKVEAATTNGLKLTTQYGQTYYSEDNVYRRAFSVQYAGAQASAQMTVSGSTVTLFAPAGTAVATIDLNTYSSIQQLVDFINTVAGFSATVLDGNGDLAALNGLDYVTAQDVKTALYTATGTLQAAVDWLNGQGEGYVTATRHAGAGTLPAVLPFTYLAGGSDGVTTNTQWSDVFTTLQGEDVQWVCALSADPSIAAMADAHVQYMSTTGRKERRCMAGTDIGTTDAAAIAAALNINSDRTSLVHIGYYDYNDAGALTLYPPYKLAAIIAAAFSGVNPGVALTNKSLTLRGLERYLRNPTDTDPLILGGVLCVEHTKTGYRVVKSISTWLNNSNYDKVEVSTGVALDYTARSVRDALDILRGQGGSPQILAQAVSIAETTLRNLSKPAPAGPGVLVGDANSPAYKNITASIIGDVLAVQFQCSPIIPVNYIPVTIFAVPYSGTATAA